VHQVHQELDIAVFPSIEDSESFGVSAVEAQACARPVIVSRVGGLPEVVRENTTGLVVPPRDEVGLAQAILRLLEDPRLARRPGASTYALSTISSTRSTCWKASIESSCNGMCSQGCAR